MSKISEQVDRLKEIIRSEWFIQTLRKIPSIESYRASAEFVRAILRKKDEAEYPPELVEAILEVFLNARKDYRPQHGYWVRGLSTFTGILWERRIDKWIKTFNEVSFSGADDLDDHYCSERLVTDFVEFAKFDDDPADFHLAIENLSWFHWPQGLMYAKARIETGRFESEEDFLRWKLRRPETYHYYYDEDVQYTLIDLDWIRLTIQRIKDLGADASEFDDLERALLVEQLNQLTERHSRQHERLEKEIQETRAALAE